MGIHELPGILIFGYLAITLTQQGDFVCVFAEGGFGAPNDLVFISYGNWGLGCIP